MTYQRHEMHAQMCYDSAGSASMTGSQQEGFVGAAAMHAAWHVWCCDPTLCTLNTAWHVLCLCVQVAMEKGLSPQQAAQALTEEALSAHSVTPATRDNITVLVVQFAPMPSPAAG